MRDEKYKVIIPSKDVKMKVSQALDATRSSQRLPVHTVSSMGGLSCISVDVNHFDP